MKSVLRSLLLFVGFAVLVLILVVTFARKHVSEQAFRMAATKRIASDPSADLPDGLHVYLCGTGSPLPDDTRAGPCMGVLAGDEAFIIDAGSGAVRKLVTMGFPMDKVEAVFLTHLHSDHIDGLGELLLQTWIGGERITQLPVYGPAGTVQVVDGFNAAYRIDSGYRTGHHGEAVANPSGFGGLAQEISRPEGSTASADVMNSANVRVRVVPVNHEPVKPAFAYRFDYKGRSVSFSGDTVKSNGFIELCQGVDVMFHEALNRDMVTVMQEQFDAVGNSRMAKIMSDIKDYHASPSEAAVSASDAGADELVYYHMVPPLPSRLLYPAFIGDSHKAFKGKILVGEDGMLISLPAGSNEITQSQILP